jgi:hypothetical protein
MIYEITVLPRWWKIYSVDLGFGLHSRFDVLAPKSARSARQIAILLMLERNDKKRVDLCGRFRTTPVTSRKINRCSVNERDREHDEEAHRGEEIDGGNFESWMF